MYIYKYIHLFNKFKYFCTYHWFFFHCHLGSIDGIWEKNVRCSLVTQGGQGIRSVTLLLLGGCHPKVWLISYGFQYWLQYISSLFVHCLLNNFVTFSSSFGEFTENKNMHQLKIGKSSSCYWTDHSPISVASCKVKIRWSTLCRWVSLWEFLNLLFLAAWFSIFR